MLDARLAIRLVYPRLKERVQPLLDVVEVGIAVDAADVSLWVDSR